MYVVIAFPDREFALHMFTVSVPKAAVYCTFFFLFSGVYNCKTESPLLFSKVHTQGIMSKSQIYYVCNNPLYSTLQYV